ncbi:MAG: OmpP1/FadL family transporter [Burkholderiaceae bacterium]
MKKLFFLILMGSSLTIYAQEPQDGLRLSWFAPSGTARSNALGGAMGSLGGDLSSNHINPAGLGFYKSSELLLTPKFLVQTNNFTYRGTSSSTTNSKSNFGSVGIVFADGQKRNNWTSTAFSITFNQIANYNNHSSFGGKNNFSSFSEKYLEELVGDRADTNAALGNYIFGSSLAFRTYLVDTTANAKGAVTGYQSLVPISTGVNQSYDAITTGSYDELAFGWGGNMEDKLYLGASLVLPMINYTKSVTYSEADATSNPDNNFGGFVIDEHFSSRGWGLGAKLGIIYKPESFLRVGFTIHTPQVISFRDQMSASMTTNTEKYAGIQSASSSELNNGYPGTREYTVATPTKAILSTSYFFASPGKPAQPLGFISADLEFINYAATRFYSNNYDKATSDYYNLINSAVKASYKNNINFKIGSEIKLTSNWMIRAGAAYYGSPYKDETLKASRMVLSGGIGYRTNRNFIDFTIVSSSSKDAVFPYRLNDKPNTYANLTGNQLLFNIGYGIRF